MKKLKTIEEIRAGNRERQRRYQARKREVDKERLAQWKERFGESVKAVSDSGLEVEM